jgi:hypothetical protein
MKGQVWVVNSRPEHNYPEGGAGKDSLSALPGKANNCDGQP